MANSTLATQRSHAVAFTRKGLAFHLALLACFGCSSYPLLGQPSSPPQPTYRPEEVLVVEQAGFDELSRSGKYNVSEPLGEVSATAPCVSGSVDDKCVEAARQRLREVAGQQGANLALVVKGAVLQSYPPQYAVTGVLYRISPRQ